MVARFSFSFVEQIVGTPHPGAKVYFVCSLLLILCTGPLAFFLPFSSTALLLTLAFMATLSFSSLSAVTSTKWLLSLQPANFLVLTTSAILLFRDFGLSLGIRCLMIALLFAALALLSYYGVPQGLMRRSVPVQQMVFAATLVPLLLVRDVHVADALKVRSWEHLDMALRSLFLGPLGMFAVVFVSGFTGWARSLLLLAGACLGQYAIGLLELGIWLDVRLLRFASFISGCGFVLLLVAAVVPRRAKKAGKA